MKKRWRPVSAEAGFAKTVLLQRDDGVLLAFDASGDAGWWYESDEAGRPTAEGPEVFDLIEALADIERVRGE